MLAATVKNMAKFILTIGLLLYLTTNSFCQDDKYLKFPDTIHIYKPKIDTLQSLESIEGKSFVIDTLNNSSAFLLQIYLEQFINKNVVAVKRGNNFIVFPVLSERSYREIETEKISLSNKHNILLIKYTASIGISQATHGWAEYTKGFQIWDLDEILCLASIDNYYSHLEWDNNSKDDSSNICENYIFTITDRVITLTEQNSCNEFAEKLKAIASNETITFNLTNEGAIKLK